MLTQGHMVLTKNEQGRIMSMGATLCPIDFSIGQTANQHVVVPLGLCYMQPPASSSMADNVCNMPVWPDTMFKKALDIMGTPVLHSALTEETADEPAKEPAIRHVKRFTRRRSLTGPAPTAPRTKRVLMKDKPTRSG